AAGATLLLAAAVVLARYLAASVNQRLLERLRDRAARRLLSSRALAVRGRPAGELASRVFSDASSLSGFVEVLLKRLVGDGLDALGSIAVAFLVEWRLATAAVVLAPLLGLLLGRLGRVVRRKGSLAQRELGELHSVFAEQISGLTTIQGYDAAGREADRFAASNASYRRRVLAAELWSAAVLASIFLVTGLGFLGAIGWGSRLALASELTPAGLLAFCLFAARTVEPLRRLADVHAMLQRTLAAAARVYEVIDFGFLERQGGTPLPRPVRGDLSLEGVRFRHDPSRPLLEGVDLRVAPGETVAVVATSDGGKSTLAAILAGFLPPDAGRLSLDGVDRREADLRDLRHAVRLVEQEPFLFRGSLAQNVLFGRPEASRDEVVEALGLCGLAGLVAAIPGGIDGSLLESGRNLSGGQKQRIALARAVLTDPPVLVLDEATSALDSETEGRLLDDLGPWLARRTVIVMAHRLSTVARYPRVIVLVDGRVEGDGPASRLLDTCPPFRALFAGQVEPVPNAAT
ncbi:MAG: ABC transporter ATP-binding protein/permease, partial [Thermoanaerobaculia bacterium]|nr:ABC transporter ATP-binding protein/permease [Thermoanaerobaculia bacterium]